MAELREGSIFGLGNPLLDILANVDGEFLEKWSLLPNNAILADPEKHKGLYEDMIDKYGEEIKYVAGGATQNSMRVSQWFLKKPRVCTFTGCIGNDIFGEMMLKKAQEDGVNVIYSIDEEEKTGTCAVLVTEKGTQRSLCAYLGAANNFKKEHLLKNWESVEKATVYYVSGFHLTVSPDSILEIARHSHESQGQGKNFCFNLSAPFISQFYSDQLLSVLPYIDILFGNETEAKAFSTMKKWPEELTVREIAIRIAKEEKANKEKERIVIITQGEECVVLVKGVKEDGVKEYPITRLPAAQIIDTNGAGDAFVGGFLSQLILDKDLDVCIAAAIYAATEIIQLSGCAFPQECKFGEK